MPTGCIETEHVNSETPNQALSRIDPLPIRAVFERQRLANRWQSHSWRLVDVLPDALPSKGPGTGIEPLSLMLHRDEAEGYYLNVTSGEPSIFVMWRFDDPLPGSQDDAQPRALAATLSYNEAGRWMDGGETVDRVAMPAAMTAWLTEYVNLHYQPEQGRKRRGTKPSFLARDEFASMAARETRETRDTRDTRDTREARQPGTADLPDGAGPAGRTRR